MEETYTKNLLLLVIEVYMNVSDNEHVQGWKNVLLHRKQNSTKPISYILLCFNVQKGHIFLKIT